MTIYGDLMFIYIIQYGSATAAKEPGRTVEIPPQNLVLHEINRYCFLYFFYMYMSLCQRLLEWITRATISFSGHKNSLISFVLACKNYTIYSLFCDWYGSPTFYVHITPQAGLPETQKFARTDRIDELKKHLAELEKQVSI